MVGYKVQLVACHQVAQAKLSRMAHQLSESSRREAKSAVAEEILHLTCLELREKISALRDSRDEARHQADSLAAKLRAQKKSASKMIPWQLNFLNAILAFERLWLRRRKLNQKWLGSRKKWPWRKNRGFRPVRQGIWPCPNITDERLC